MGGGFVPNQMLLLEFNRYAHTPGTYKSAHPFTEDGNPVFYAFDYYDQIICNYSHLEDSKPVKVSCRECFGLSYKNSRSSVLARQFITLVRYDGENRMPLPMLERTEARDKPFLSFIFATMLPSFGNIKTLIPEVQYFLGELLDSISKGLDKMVPDCEKTDSLYEVYHSMNTGNICIIVRSSKPETAYNIAEYVRRLGSAEDNGTIKWLRFSTFTISSVQLWVDMDKKQLDLPEDLLSCASDTEVILRFTHNALLSGSANMPGPPKGLFGRYDSTVQLPLHSFFKLLPQLCVRKFPELSEALAPAPSVTKDKGVHWLSTQLAEGKINIINERLSIALPSHISAANVNVENAEVYGKMQEELQDKLDNLRGKLYQELRVRYSELDKGLELIADIIGSFQALIFEDDSRIASRIFYRQMYNLLKIIDGYLLALIENGEQNSIQQIDDFNESIHAAVTAFSGYHRLLQSINRQSVQAPNYELQMHMDTEKYLIAYTNFAKRFLNAFRFDSGNNGTDFPWPEVTVLSVRTQQKSLTSSQLFLLPLTKSGNGFYRANQCRDGSAREERIVLSILLPGVESLGRMYEILPVLCHELSHSLRPMGREDRNRTLLGLVFHVLARLMVQYIGGTEGSVNNPKEMLSYRLEKAAAGKLMQFYLDIDNGMLKFENVGALKQNIFIFIRDYLSPKTEYSIFNGAYEKVKAQIHKAIYAMAKGCIPDGEVYAKLNQHYGEWLKENPDMEQDPRRISEKGRFPEWKAAVQRKTAELLDRFRGIYYSDFIGYLSGIKKEYNLEDNVEGYGRIQDVLKGMQDLDPSIVEDWSKNLYETVKKWLNDCVPEIKRKYILAQTIDFLNGLRDADQYIAATMRQLERLNNVDTDDLMSQLYDCLCEEVRKTFSEFPLYSSACFEWLLPLNSDAGMEKGPARQDGINYLSKVVLNPFMWQKLYDAAAEAIHCYRETTADLGMCAALGLNVFGYLDVLSTRPDATTKLENGTDSVWRDRILMVAFTLCDGSMDKLIADLHNFIYYLRRYIDKSTDDEYLRETWEGTLDEYRIFLDGKRDKRFLAMLEDSLYSLQPLEHTGKDFPNALSPEEQIRALRLLKCAFTVLKGKENDVYPEIIKHLRKLYSKLNKTAVRLREKNPTLETVGNYHNNTELRPERATEAARMRSLFLFVLSNYYDCWSECCLEESGCGGK